MEPFVIKIWLFYLFLLFSYQSSSLPLCTDLREPVTPNKPLAFCEYNGTVCCTPSQDSEIQKRFQAMNISDDSCASTIKSILCATCDKYSAELFKVKSGPRPVPVLCEATAPAVKLSSISNPGNSNFCSAVWDTCKDISILSSPFSPSLQNKAGGTQNSSASKFIDFWDSEKDFCTTFGSTSDGDSICFDGKQVELNETETSPPPKGMCLEKVGNGSYLNMVAHPDGSNRAFFSDQAGKIWLATIPDMDSGEALGLDESDPFVDLTDQVHLDTNFGMMGLAFHPEFSENGRFFASFNCDKVTNPGCSGRCSCNSDVGCDPSKLDAPSSAPTCQFHTVVAEYSANGTSAPSTAKNAKPAEVRRIFTMGLPYKKTAGGQILFGPEDGYLYLMMGDGGGKGDPLNFSQNKKSLMGKIMRLDVNNMPSDTEIADLSLWGNYSTPRDNPYADDKDMAPEIWAYGLRNPWRCSFDSERPSYFICGDSGENAYEEVDIITKGGNYGWRLYEGPLVFNLEDSLPKNTSADSIGKLIFPIVGYNHSEVNKKLGSASISGGYVYRSSTDPCLYGSYLYGDLYGENYWTATENPKDSGKFTSASLPFACGTNSPIQCTTTPNSPLPAIGYIFSTGQDNKKDVYILTSSGVYRIVRPSRCHYTCAKENATTTVAPSPPSPSSNSPFIHPYLVVVLLSFIFFVL